jgi:DNA-directed RNA polymerase specialized sigma24 family protein
MNELLHDWLLSPRALRKMEEITLDPCYDGSPEVLSEFLRRMESERQAIKLDGLPEKTEAAFRLIGWKGLHLVETPEGIDPLEHMRQVEQEGGFKFGKGRIFKHGKPN